MCGVIILCVALGLGQCGPGCENCPNPSACYGMTQSYIPTLQAPVFQVPVFKSQKTPVAYFMLLGPSPEDTDFMVFFHGPGCVPCEYAKPVVAALKKAGYDIRSVDTSLAASKRFVDFYRIDQNPIFVRVVGGREINRQIGFDQRTGQQDLINLYNGSVKAQKEPQQPVYRESFYGDGSSFFGAPQGQAPVFFPSPGTARRGGRRACRSCN